MAEYLIQDTTLTAIANAVRTKTDTTGSILVSELASKINSIETGSDVLNFEVVGGTTEPSNPKENTIWVNTDALITSWSFSAENPATDAPITDCFSNVSLGDGYFDNTGSITSSSNDKYTNDYIPVTPGREYDWSYAVSSSLSLWMIVIEYDESKNVIGSVEIVGNVTTTKSIGTYVPSSEDVKYVRLSWRHSNAVVSFCYKDLSDFEGFVWMKTSVSSNVEFNAIKKNSLQIYPNSVFLCDGNAWVSKTAKSYQGGKWVDWGTYLYYFGNECASLTGGWSGTNATISKNDTNINIAVGGGTDGYMRTVNTIGLAGYSQLEILFDYYFYNVSDSKYLQGLFQLRVLTSSGTTAASVDMINISSVGPKAERSDSNLSVILDISSLAEGTYYVDIYKGYSNYVSGNVTMHKLQLK